MKCSYSASIYQFHYNIHVFCLGTSNKVVAVYSHDSIRTCKPYATLAVHSNYNVQNRNVYIHMPCACTQLYARLEEIEADKAPAK